jgi:signal peptidase I
LQEPEFRHQEYRTETDGDGAATTGKPKEKESFLSFLGELPILILTAVVVAWLIKTLVVQPFFIPSSSMEPTLVPGDRVLVSKFIYRFTEPDVNDVVVFVAPDQGVVEQDFIKRVVATEGMRVQVDDGRLLVDGEQQAEPFIRPDSPNSNFGPLTVPDDHVFVMGDNRANSKDSRFFGPVAENDLVGRAFLIYWPPRRAGQLE